MHTRFEHSLGTYYLADQAINRLKNFQVSFLCLSLGAGRPTKEVVKGIGWLRVIEEIWNVRTETSYDNL